MTSKADALAALRDDHVAAVVRGGRVDDPARLCETLVEAGIRCVEFTFTIPNTAEVISRAVAGRSDAIVGAGTVLTKDHALAAIDAGACFVVSPSLVPEVAAVCSANDVALYMGALSPSEVAQAMSMGADAIKIFPAGLAGPRYLRDLRGPFPDAVLLPSGGVTASNASEFLAAGAMAVFAGSDLLPPQSVENGDYVDILKRAEALRSALVV